MSQIELGIVILNYKGIDITKKCIESIYKHENDDNFKVVIVDNCSGGDEYEHLKKCAANYEFVDLIENKSNKGYAHGNNLGVDYLNEVYDVKYISIINNDVILTQPIFMELVSFLNENMNCGLVTPLLKSSTNLIDLECARRKKRIFDQFLKITILGKIKKLKQLSDKHTYILDCSYRNTNNTPIEIELASGATMFFRKEVFLGIGKLDENTFLYYEEDIIAEKLRNRRLTSILLPWVECIHLGALSTNQESKTKISRFYLESMSYFLEKYSKKNIILRYLLVALISLKLMY